MSSSATQSAHETGAEMAPVPGWPVSGFGGEAWSLPGLDAYHQALFAARHVPVSVADMPACAAEVPLLHCHLHEVGDVKVTFSRPLPAAVTLTVSHTVAKERLAAGTTHASVDAQYLQALCDGISCAFVEVLDDDGLPPSGVEARLTTAYVQPSPPLAQSEEEKRVICRALHAHYMTAGLGGRLQVHEAKVEALLAKCMLQQRILATDVPSSAWPFAYDPRLEEDAAATAEVLDEVASFMDKQADNPGASFDESVVFMAEHSPNIAAFSTRKYRSGKGDKLHVPSLGDVLFGLNMFPAVDTDDLVLRFGGSPPIHLCVRNGTVRLSRPLWLCLLALAEPDLEMRGLSAYEVVFSCGLLCHGHSTLVGSMPRVCDAWGKEQGTMEYSNGLGWWTPNGGL